jgi:hypothetical protein
MGIICHFFEIGEKCGINDGFAMFIVVCVVVWSIVTAQLPT